MAPRHFQPRRILRRANVSRISGSWQHENYNVFERDVGRVYLVDGYRGNETWGVSFQLTKRKSYGHATSLDEAKAAFGAEYEARKARRG
jgi:hypothetical protein